MKKFLDVIPCMSCGGSGNINCPECNGRGVDFLNNVCPTCSGNQNIPCPDCNNGNIEVNYDIEKDLTDFDVIEDIYDDELNDWEDDTIILNADEFMEDVYNEISVNPHKQTRQEKRMQKKQRRLARRGTNFKSVQPKKGFKRVKIGNKYIRVRMTTTEKIAHKAIGRAVGKKLRLFR